MIAILEQILSDKPNRQRLISQFQKIVWNDERASDLLSEVAYDLDYYEPDEKEREREPSYYGDDRLEQEINEVMQKLKYKSPD